MALNENALIDKTFFDQMWQGQDIDPDRLDNIINAMSLAFELFCNRKLKERTYTYVEGDESAQNDIYYVPEYAIFDAPPKNIFWFPTYPVASITSFYISSVEITAATGYVADDGYILNKRTGRLVYEGGFDYNYLQNIQVVWKGGYPEDSAEMSHLRFLCISAMKDYINSPNNETFESEKIGNYSYKVLSPYFLNSLSGYSPKVYNELKRYRKEAIG
jgi:hypothetical protein